MNKKTRSSCFVTNLDLSLSGKLRDDLESQGFALSKPPYTVFSGKKKGVSCTLYESGKLTVQGKEMQGFIEYYLEPEILGTFDYNYGEVKLDLTPHIGSDEAGKGDYFGSLCVAAVYANGDEIKKLHELGVQDSKKMSDPKIFKLADEIKKLCHHEVLILRPEKYNELYGRFKNLNSLLAWGHGTVIEGVYQKTSCEKVLIDQFVNPSVMKRFLKREMEMESRPRAEEDTVVAAASMLARAGFVRHLERLEKEAGSPLPKGASQKVKDAARLLVAKYGPDALGKYVKLHFKTTGEVIG